MFLSRKNCSTIAMTDNLLFTTMTHNPVLLHLDTNIAKTNLNFAGYFPGQAKTVYGP